MASNAGVSVEVWVYDLSKGMMAAMSQPLLGKHLDGLWHTSIVVNGKESVSFSFSLVHGRGVTSPE
jgi:hypothetical protein